MHDVCTYPVRGDDRLRLDPSGRWFSSLPPPPSHPCFIKAPAYAATVQGPHLRPRNRYVLHRLGQHLRPERHHDLPRRRLPQGQRQRDRRVEPMPVSARRGRHGGGAAHHRRDRRRVDVHAHDGHHDGVDGAAGAADEVRYGVEDRAGEEVGWEVKRWEKQRQGNERLQRKIGMAHRALRRVHRLAL